MPPGYLPHMLSRQQTSGQDIWRLLLLLQGGVSRPALASSNSWTAAWEGALLRPARKPGGALRSTGPDRTRVPLTPAQAPLRTKHISPPSPISATELEPVRSCRAPPICLSLWLCQTTRLWRMLDRLPTCLCSQRNTVLME